MKKLVMFFLVLVTTIMMANIVLAGQRNIVGNWNVTFKGYYGNKQTGPMYGEVKATLYITEQKEGSFAGTVEIEGQPDTYLLTGNIKNNKIVMIIGGNTFIRGNVRGSKLYLVMETQQMSDDDTQGVLDGVATKE
jgi:hypothetical protein